MNPITRLRIVPAVLAFILIAACSEEANLSTDPELERLAARAQNVTIIRDDFGVPHIYAKTDADAVFGLLYAQAEDDFKRIERNYIWATGRLAEIEGESAIFSDLRARLFQGQLVAFRKQVNRAAFIHAGRQAHLRLRSAVQLQVHVLAEELRE